MKICIFTDTIDKNSGGPSRSVPILVKGLAKIGYDVTLMTQQSNNMNTHILDNCDAKLIILSSGCSKKEIENKILEVQFDIIHSQGIWLPIYHKLANIALKHRIPYIVTPRGDLEPWSLSQKWLKKRLALALYQRSDIDKSNCIMATADMERDNLRNLGFKRPIAVAPNGIDVSEYERRKEEFKPSVKKQIVFLSRIHQKKGIEYLIAAWKQLKAQYPEWNVVIAGNGEEAYIQQLKDLIKSKGLRNCVEIIPPLFGEAKHKLYCESSLFVLPTYSENFGMVIAEAMSCGVPVITTNGTPWQELNDLNLGWCIDLSIDNLVKTIDEAISLGQDELFYLGQKCSKHIHDTYQYTEVAEKNKAVYEWIVNGAEKPDYVSLV